jgi:hypothetical protein
MKYVALALSVLLLSSAHAKLVNSPEEFCGRLKENAPARPDAQSLLHVRIAAGLDSLGRKAKDSAPEFEKAGFENLLKEDPKILEDGGKHLPKGAILVLEKKGGCPVSKQWGHVAVKCGGDELYWVSNQTKSLSQFIKEQRGCIKAVMYTSHWDPKDPLLPEKASDGGADK